jgi:hypothetical protein
MLIGVFLQINSFHWDMHFKYILKARLHYAIFAYDCCMQLADAIPATLCHLYRRYDYCMRLFQPRDILDPLSSFFYFVLVTLWTGGIPISPSLISLLVSAFLNYFFIKNVCQSRKILKQVLKISRLFCAAYDCRKEVVGLSTRHDSCRRDGVSKLHRKQKSHRVDGPLRRLLVHNYIS